MDNFFKSPCFTLREYQCERPFSFRSQAPRRRWWWYAKDEFNRSPVIAAIVIGQYQLRDRVAAIPPSISKTIKTNGRRSCHKSFARLHGTLGRRTVEKCLPLYHYRCKTYTVRNSPCREITLGSSYPAG